MKKTSIDILFFIIGLIIGTMIVCGIMNLNRQDKTITLITDQETMTAELIISHALQKQIDLLEIINLNGTTTTQLNVSGIKNVIITKELK